MTKADISFAKSEKCVPVTTESAQPVSIHKNKDD